MPIFDFYHKILAIYACPLPVGWSSHLFIFKTYAAAAIGFAPIAVSAFARRNERRSALTAPCLGLTGIRGHASAQLMSHKSRFGQTVVVASIHDHWIILRFDYAIALSIGARILGRWQDAAVLVFLVLLAALGMRSATQGWESDRTAMVGGMFATVFAMTLGSFTQGRLTHLAGPSTVTADALTPRSNWAYAMGISGAGAVLLIGIMAMISPPAMVSTMLIYAASLALIFVIRPPILTLITHIRQRLQVSIGHYPNLARQFGVAFSFFAVLVLIFNAFGHISDEYMFAISSLSFGAGSLLLTPVAADAVRFSCLTGENLMQAITRHLRSGVPTMIAIILTAAAMTPALTLWPLLAIIGGCIVIFRLHQIALYRCMSVRGADLFLTVVGVIGISTAMMAPIFASPSLCAIFIWAAFRSQRATGLLP